MLLKQIFLTPLCPKVLHLFVEELVRKQLHRHGGLIGDLANTTTLTCEQLNIYTIIF